MYTYTHIAVGMVVGELLFPENFYAQLGVIMGAVIPDAVTAGKLIFNTLRRKKDVLDTDIDKLTNCIHSFLMWTPLFIICLPFFIGGYSHIIIDLLSHKKNDFENPKWLWPIPWKFNLGLFDFRKNWKKREVKLLPSFPEAIILAISICILLKLFK